MMAEVFQELVLQGTVPPGSLCPLRRSRISKEAERQLYWELLINSKDTRMRKIYIVSACRTPIGKMGGVLRGVPAVRLGEIVIREAVARAKIAREHIDRVYMGCVIQAGLGQNIARQTRLLECLERHLYRLMKRLDLL